MFFDWKREAFYFLFCRLVGPAFLKKNNIFAFVNIAKVSSYSVFDEFCFLFSQVM